ncbi:ATP-binding protein [Saccharothrix isguenensis]
MALPADRDGGHGHGVERALQRSFTALVLLCALSWLGTLATTPSVHEPPVLLALVAQVANWAALCTRSWRARLGPVDAVLSAVVAVVVLGALSAVDVAAVAPGTRIQFVVVPATLAAGFLPVPTAVAVVLPLMGAYVAASIPVEGAAAVGGLWPVLSAAVASGVVAPTLRAAAGAADAAHDELVVVRAREALAESRRAVYREFQRLLHDRVTAALHAVSLAVGTVEEVRQACRAGVEALRADAVLPGTDLVHLGSLLRRSAACARTPVEVDLPDAAVTVPEVVARAVVLAVEEALRNADRHAHASRVVLTLKSSRGDVVVSVGDDGVGRRGPERAGALGLRRSITQRMVDVGGSAVVTESPGAGTTVVLLWSPEPDDRPDRTRLLALAVGDIRRPLGAVCLPYLAGSAFIGALHVGSAPGWGWLVAWALVLCAATVLLLRRADRPMGGREAVVTIAGLLVLIWLGLALMPADSLSGYASWPVGSVGPVLTVLAVIRPPWESLLVCVLEIAALGVLIATSVLDAPPLPAMVPVVLAPVFGTVMGAVIAATVRRYGGVVARSRAEQFAVVTARARRDAVDALRGERAAALALDFGPFLEAVARGEAEHGHPATRARAAELERVARDELHLPGVLDARTKAALARARGRGCVVDLHADTDGAAVPDQVVTLLRAALAGDPPHRLTLSLYPAPEGVLVSLVAVPGDSARGARLATELSHLHASVEDDEEATCVEFTA